MKWRWTRGLAEELMYSANGGLGYEKEAGGRGVAEQLWSRQEPKRKPGWEATYCS